MTAPLRDPEILRRSLDLFRAVCDLETGEQLRSIQDACGSEPELRAAVEALLIADRAESDPLSDHAIDLAARDTTPDEIDGFKVVGVLGRGGMGIVYDAEQQHPRRRVAIKVIRPGSDSPTLRARIRREAEVLAMLRHPGIAQIHHAGEFAGSPYLVMERVDGVSLANATAKCDLRDRIGLIARIVDAVHHAHQRGIIHRDLKPDNILVNEEAPGRFQPKILDFGIARAADESLHATLADSLTIAEGGSLVGTLAYMSPEQIQGNREIDVRTDVYALGMIAHELLTGVKGKDLTGLSVVAAMRAAIENEPRPIGDIDPKLRGDIQTIIRKATETDRERRYQSAAEFAADLRRYLASEPITARPPSLGYLTGRLIARNKGVFAGVSVAVLALLAGLLVSLFAAASEHRQRSRSDRMLYAGSVSGAADALADHNPFRARQLLTIAPEELRGWEWDLLNTRLDPGQQLADTGLEFAVFGPGPDIGQSGPEILVAGAYEGRIRIGRLDADRFTPTHDLEPSAPLNHLSRFMFSPSGQTLFLTDLINNTVTQFDTRTGLETEHHTVSGLRPVGSFEPGEPVDGWVADGVACYRFGNAPRLARVVEHPQLGPVFAVYSQDRYDGQYMLGIVNAQTRRVLRRYPSDSQFGQNAWSHDGNRVYAINVSGWLRVFEPGEDTGPPWGPVRLGSLLPRAFVLSEDASTAYAGLPDSTALAVDTRTGTLIRGFPLTGTSVIDLHIDPERSRLMASLDDGRIVAFSEQQSPLAFTGHLGAVNPLAITPDGSRLVSGSWDGTVRVWDTGSGSALHTARVSYPNGAPAAVLELAMSPDGSECAVIATSAFDRPVMTCRIALDTGAISGVAVASKVGRASARYAPDGTPHLFGSVFDLPPENTTLRALPNTPFGFTRPVSQNPERFAHGVPGGGIAIRDIRTGEELAAFTHQAAQLGVIALSPDANAVALGDFRAQVEVVDARDGRPIGTLDGHSGGVLGVAWSPDGTRIATASRDGTVGIWDAKTYRLLVRLNGHSDYVFDVVWSPDGRTLYSSSGDGSVRVWRADRPETR